MHGVDLSQLSLPALVALEADVQEAIVRRKETERRELTSEIKRMAAESGFSLDELFGQVKASQAQVTVKKSVRKKYRNPHNPEQTWTGRGKRPRWVTEKLSQNYSLEDLLIDRGNL